MYNTKNPIGAGEVTSGSYSNPFGVRDIDASIVDAIDDSTKRVYYHWQKRRAEIIDKLNEARKILSEAHEYPSYSPAMKIRNVLKKFYVGDTPIENESDFFRFLRSDEIRNLKVKEPEKLMESLEEVVDVVIENNEKTIGKFESLIQQLDELDSRVPSRIKDLDPRGPWKENNIAIKMEYMGHHSYRENDVKTIHKKIKENFTKKEEWPDSIDPVDVWIETEIKLKHARRMRSIGYQLMIIGFLIMLISIVGYFLSTGDPLTTIKETFKRSFKKFISDVRMTLTEENYIRLFKRLLIGPFIAIYNIIKSLGVFSMLGIVGFLMISYGFYLSIILYPKISIKL